MSDEPHLGGGTRRGGEHNRKCQAVERKSMDQRLYAQQTAANIAYCYVGAGARLHVGTPLLEVRIGDSPLQTILYDGIRSVVVRRVMLAVGASIDSLPASIPLAVVENIQEGAADVTEAVLSVSIFRQGYYQALLSLASWREDEQTLVLEVVPARLVPSRLPPRYRALLSRPHLAAVPGRRMEAHP